MKIILSFIIIAISSITAHAEPSNFDKAFKTQPALESEITQIKKYNNLIIKTYATQMEGFGNNEKSIIFIEKELTAYLQKKPRGLKEKEVLITLNGSFYGETIIKNIGGTWVNVNGELAIKEKNGYTFPYSSVKQFIDNGDEDSLHHAYLVAKKLSNMSVQEIQNQMQNSK